MHTLPRLEKAYRQTRRALIEAKNAQGLTQTQAARELGVSLTCLNNIIRREKIVWRVIKQGVRNETV